MYLIVINKDSYKSIKICIRRYFIKIFFLLINCLDKDKVIEMSRKHGDERYVGIFSR